jgi:hypothetical protein
MTCCVRFLPPAAVRQPFCFTTLNNDADFQLLEAGSELENWGSAAILMAVRWSRARARGRPPILEFVARSGDHCQCGADTIHPLGPSSQLALSRCIEEDFGGKMIADAYRKVVCGATDRPACTCGWPPCGVS